MIILHGFGQNFGVIDPSPFVLKVHAYLTMSNIDFEYNNDHDNYKKAPKGKLPFIIENDNVIGDSQFIIEHIKKEHGDILDKHLNREQKAQAYLLTKSLDENLYFCLFYSRWCCEKTWPILKKAYFSFLPPIIRHLVPAMYRKSLIKGLKVQGINRHSYQEVLHINGQSLQALSDMLSNKKYMFGEQPCSFDATCYGLLAQYIMVDINNPFNEQAKKFNNLVSYCQRIKKQYY